MPDNSCRETLIDALTAAVRSFDSVVDEGIDLPAVKNLRREVSEFPATGAVAAAPHWSKNAAPVLPATSKVTRKDMR